MPDKNEGRPQGVMNVSTDIPDRGTKTGMISNSDAEGFDLSEGACNCEGE